MRATQPQNLFVTRLPGTDLSQRLFRRDRASLTASRFSTPHVDARSQYSTESSRQRADQWPRQVPQPQEQQRNKDGPPRQPSREVGELDLEHLWHEAFGHEERQSERLRVTPRLAHPPTRRRRNHLVDLEVACIGEVNHQA